MCFGKKTLKKVDETDIESSYKHPLCQSISSSARTPIPKTEEKTPRGEPFEEIYQTKNVPVETKPEQVHSRLNSIIKNLLNESPSKKTTTDTLALKLTEKNKLDEERASEKNISQEFTCDDEDDANFHKIRKDIIKVIKVAEKKKERKEKIEKKEKKEHEDKAEKELDTEYETTPKVLKISPSKTKAKDSSITPVKAKISYKRDARQFTKSTTSTTDSDKQNMSPNQKGESIDYDTEQVNEKNFMYNLKEIDYCTHDMMRCIEEDNLFKNIKEDSEMPRVVQPYGNLELLAKRQYTSCKVLRRNTLLSTILSMSNADEKDRAAMATAKIIGACNIRFLPVTEIPDEMEKTAEIETEPVSMKSAKEKVDKKKINFSHEKTCISDADP